MVACGASHGPLLVPDGIIIADDQSASGLAIDATNLYWTTLDGSVMSLPLASPDSQTALFTGIPTRPSSIAVDGNYVYWTELGSLSPSEGAVRRIAISGGTPEPLAGAQNASDAIVINARAAYWATYNEVLSVALTGGTVVPIVDDGIPEEVGGVALDDQYVYWTRGNPFRSPLAGGQRQQLNSDKFGPGSIAVDGTSVYWTVGPEPCDTSSCVADHHGYVLKAPKGGGASVMLAELETPSDPGTRIAVDSTYVYWTTAHEVQRTPLDGGAIETLASGQGDPHALVLGANDVYWASGPVGSYPAAIRTVPK